MVKKSLVIVYHWFPHYRGLLFSELSKIFNLKLVGDKVSNYENLRLMDLKKFNFHNVKNLWIGPFLFQKGLISYIRNSSRKNFIFLADWRFISTWIILIFFKKDNSIVGWTHGISNNDFFFLKFLKYIYYGLFDEIFTYNETASNILNEARISSKPIYNANSLMDELPRKNGFETDWLFVGRITEERLIINFINEMANNIGILNDTVFHIIGPCNFSDKILKIISKNNLKDNVTYYGEIYDWTKIKEISKSCKYFIHPTDTGLSALLALNLNLFLFTHDDLNSHKPEIEAILESKRIITYKKNQLSLSTLILDKKSLNRDIDLVNKVRVKWSINNQIKIIKQYYYG